MMQESGGHSLSSLRVLWKKVFDGELLKHPFVVACFTAVAGAVVAGLFTLWSAYIQKGDPESSVVAHAPPKQALPERADDVHVAKFHFGSQENYFFSDAAYQKGEGYDARMEACVGSNDGKQAICIFTVRPNATITITNSENYSQASRVEGEKAVTCCLFFNDGKNGFHIISEKTNGHAVIGRRTVSPPNKMTVLIAIPNLDDGKPLDSIVFSVGGGDPGIRFPVVLGALTKAPDPKFMLSRPASSSR